MRPRTIGLGSLIIATIALTMTIAGSAEAKHGGEGGGRHSQYASGLAVHNEILATRPDLMPVLYRGFPYHRRGEEAPTAPPITPYDVPVFSNRDGQVSVFMVREIVNAAYRELKREFTAEKSTSSTLFGPPRGACNSRPGPEPGDASFLYNYTVMHVRSEFDDWDEPEKKRLMLRLWLDVERKPRSVVWEIHIYENAGGRSGIDPQPGRLPAVAKYRTPDEEVRRRVVAE